AHVKGRKPLRKRTIASGGSLPSVGKSLRKRRKSPQVGRDRETCGLHRQVAIEVISPAGSRVRGAVVSGPSKECDKVVNYPIQECPLRRAEGVEQDWCECVHLAETRSSRGQPSLKST